VGNAVFCHKNNRIITNYCTGCEITKALSIQLNLLNSQHDITTDVGTAALNAFDFDKWHQHLFSADSNML